MFEHTADVGLHAYGKMLSELFIHAAQGMVSRMVAPEQIRPNTIREITAQRHKDAQEVVNVVHNADLAQLVARLKPVIVVKG